MNQGQVPIEHVAALARIRLTDEEILLFGKQLDDIVDMFAKLQEVDTGGVEPMSHVSDVHSVMRDDEVSACLPVDDALANVPDVDHKFVKIPPVF